MKQNTSYGFDKLEELSHVLSFSQLPKKDLLDILISNFRHVLKVVRFLLGDVSRGPFTACVCTLTPPTLSPSS